LAEEFIAKNIKTPNIYIYSLLMKAYTKSQDFEKAQNLLSFLETSECKPNDVIYNTFLQCAIECNQDD